MKRILYSAALAALGAIAVRAQAKPRLEFEVASIKPSDTSNQQTVRVGFHLDGAMVRCSYFSIKDYIGLAYDVKEYQINGPDWIASERFEINAKLPAGATRAQVPEMLQNLLTDRFGLKFHRDSKEFPVYAIVVGKNGIKMKETPPDAETAAAPASVNVAAQGGPQGVTVSLGPGSYFTFTSTGFECKKMSPASLANSLGRFMDRPVIDKTDLTANYDFNLALTPEDSRAMSIRSAITAGVVLPPDVRRLAEGSNYDSLFSAIELLGLKIERRKAPLDVLVIEKIERTPSDN